MNDRQNEQRNGGGAGQAVHRADDERAQRLIKFRAAKPAIEFRGRNGFFGMSVGGGLVAVDVAVHVIAVQMRVLVDGIVITVGGDIFHRAKGCAQIERAEQDQHKGDAEFQAHPEALRNHDAEEDDGSANDEQRQAVADAPENSGPGGAPDLALPANDGGNGDDMIGIGRVPHAEKEAEEQDGKKRRS